MSEDKYYSYEGSTLEWLRNHNLEVWDEIVITKDNSMLIGIILPRSELANPNFIGLKLSTGYNIGFDPIGVVKIKKIGHWKGIYQVPKIKIERKQDLPFIPILGCGGTIACRLDYQTGGAIPALTPEELLSSFPEIANLAKIETQLLFDEFSENINFQHYTKILQAIEKQIKTKKPQGIVLTHGTDTMSYTAAALSFAITNSPIPIVLTGSQRSSDRPSSDSFLNLYSSILYAASPKARKKVVVIMHDESSDVSCAIHDGLRLRKMHSSRRDTFRSIRGGIIGRIKNDKIDYCDKKELNSHNDETKKKRFHITKKFENNVSLVYYYPGIKSGVLEHYINNDYKGIVLMGSGLGHISSDLIPTVKKAVESGIIVIMTTQCLHGYTGLSVYETGRRLLNTGVIPVANILPEIAYIKLAYLLGNYKKIEVIKEMMITNLRGEIIPRERYLEFP